VPIVNPVIVKPEKMYFQKNVVEEDRRRILY
jgi:hypothetical protein